MVALLRRGTSPPSPQGKKGSNESDDRVDDQWLLSFDEKMKEAKSLNGNVGNGSEKMKEAESFR